MYLKIYNDNNRLTDEILEKIIRQVVNVDFYLWHSVSKCFKQIKAWEVTAYFKNKKLYLNITKYEGYYTISSPVDVNEDYYINVFSELMMYFSKFDFIKKGSFFAKLTKQDLINKKLLK